MDNFKELYEKAQEELAEAKADLTAKMDELEAEGKGFIKKNRYWFILGALIVGFILGGIAL